VSNLMPKLFCPLLSSENKKVYCKDDCMWYIETDCPMGSSCIIPALFMSNTEIVKAIEKAKGQKGS
jgi:hypothetical protein